MVKEFVEKATQTLSHSTPVALGLMSVILGLAFYCGVSFNTMLNNSATNAKQDALLQNHAEQIAELKGLQRTTTAILDRIERKIDKE